VAVLSVGGNSELSVGTKTGVKPSVGTLPELSVGKSDGDGDGKGESVGEEVGPSPLEPPSTGISPPPVGPGAVVGAHRSSVVKGGVTGGSGAGGFPKKLPKLKFPDPIPPEPAVPKLRSTPSFPL
jgi:hypothetical protein